MTRLGESINKKGTYICPKCKEKFRLKMAFNNHKCSKKDNGLEKRRKKKGR